MENLEDMELTRRLVEEGKIKAIIDKCFPMEQAAEAHRYVESGDKAGSVVITIGS
jgi:NADPH:quinone reductase-like Zn-dependent oxidoreductase